MKTRTKAVLAGAAPTTALALGAATAAGPANASTPMQDFFACLTNHNIAVVDPVYVNNMGVAIQHDLMLGYSPTWIASNLMTYWGVIPWMAPVDVQCAAATIAMGSPPYGESA
jgi:hypothetical protein